MRTKSIFFIVFFGVLFLVSFGLRKNKFHTISEDPKIEYPDYFPAPIYTFQNNPITKDGFSLGRKLFYDEILSRDSTISCHSCHQRVAAFAHIDHTLSHGIDAKVGTRNVPALQNLIWKNAYMWDGGIVHLEMQALNPLTSKIEMDESMAHILSKLKSSPEYLQLFKKAFKDSSISSKNLLKALTQFTGAMISFNSKYDKYRRGEDTFSRQERNGLLLFRSKCESCHQEPLFSDNSYRTNGLQPDSSLQDLGRGLITYKKEDNYKFKVPSLRNVEVTYPYMHDGRYRKLYDVLNHYSSLAHRFVSIDKDLTNIGTLSDVEKIDLIAFLYTLTDKEFLKDKRFANPNY